MSPLVQQEIFSAYNPPPKVKLDTGTETPTRQSEKDACDVNQIVMRFERTGLLPQDRRAALYMDVSDVGDYRTALERVRAADTLFSQLPAKVRAEFGNDAAAFLDFCSDPGNRERMAELGLIEAKDQAPPPPPPPGDSGAGTGGAA